MRVALIQMSASSDKEANLNKAIRFIQKAATSGAQFVLLPEVFIFRGNLRKGNNFKDVPEKIPGTTTRALAALAKKYKVFILAGSIYERAPGQKKVYNTSVFLNPRGEIQAKYRKINLFNARLGQNNIKEADNFLSGKATLLTKLNSFRLGLSVCFDLRFPEVYREYFYKEADVLAVPSAFTKRTGQAHWEVLLRARAIENQCYVLAPNQVGKGHRGIETYGHSMVVDPWGKILVQGSSSKEEIVYAIINHQEVRRIRRIMPLKNILN